MKRGITPALIALNVLLVGLLAWLWIDGQGIRNVHWQPPAAIRPDLGSLPAVPIQREDADISRFVAILDRPLFSPTRRPAPPAPAVAAEAVAARADPLDAVHLFGYFSGSGGGGLIARVEGKTRRLQVGESVGQWKLKEIRKGEVVFARGAETRVMPLVQARQGAATGPARPAFSAPVMPQAAPAPAAPAASQNIPPAQGGQQQSPAGAAKPSGAATASSPFVIGGSK